MEFIKRNYKFFLMFLLFFVINYVCNYQNCDYDLLWNYGFSHAIRMGEIPYLDFNTISTPLYSFIMSIGLFIWDDFLVFFIEHNILVTLLFCLIIKMYGKKGWIMFPVLTLPFFAQLNATYNFFAFFLIVLLVFLEKGNKSDYFIGFVLGLLIITKHTIGFPILLCSLISTHDLKKSGKRLLFSGIPVFLFIFYLLVINSFLSFIDLCVLGMLDFGGNNHSDIDCFVIFSCVLVAFVLFFLIKNPKNKNLYYVLGSFSFCIPLFDYYHIGLFLGILVLVYIDKIKLPENYVRNMSFLLVFMVVFFYYLVVPSKFDDLAFLDTKHLKYLIVKNDSKKSIKKVVQKYSVCDNCYMLDDTSIKYDLAVDKKITYFDVLLKGNYGYNGTNRMIEKVSEMHDVYFFIDRDKYLSVPKNAQFDVSIIKYVVKNGKKTDSVADFDIYYKE